MTSLHFVANLEDKFLNVKNKKLKKDYTFFIYIAVQNINWIN